MHERESLALIKEAIAHREAELKVYAAGNSMSPLIRKGDTLVIKHVTAGALKRGDIVVFDSRGALCAHRLIMKSARGNRYILVTKSDNSFAADAPFADKKLMGKVSCIQRGREVFNLESLSWVFINCAFGLYHACILSLRRRLRPLKNCPLKKPCNACL
jgi:signal peptidase I